MGRLLGCRPLVGSWFVGFCLNTLADGQAPRIKLKGGGGMKMKSLNTLADGQAPRIE